MFKIITKSGRARRGEYTTGHGVIQTPVFMNVATQAAIKGALSGADLKTVGCQVSLSNTYHLHIRPGDELIRSLGGLHKFMSWDGPILTDSGGFQIFSLAGSRRQSGSSSVLVKHDIETVPLSSRPIPLPVPSSRERPRSTLRLKISEEGVAFQSHVDGRKIFMSPEDSIRIQSNLGSDIAMALDECVEIPSPREYIEQSCGRTYRWLVRCKAELERQNKAPEVITPGQVLFGINQGATFKDIRISHMKQIAELDLPGYAIGGLAVGETTSEMYDIIETVEEHMPEDRPRYLMGVGTPHNIVEAVSRGVDFFDCVMPARNGRHGRFYTSEGSININNEIYKDDSRPIDGECDCPVCRTFSRAYIRHLFRAGEMLAMRLGVLHNLSFYNSLMNRIREAIESGGFETLRKRFHNYR